LTKVRGIYCLKKDEIVRGFNSFKNIFTDSKVISNGFLKLNIQIAKENSINKINDIYKDPLHNIKVGFVVSKRMVKKASQRNRLKRLAREAYRANKYMLIGIKEYEVNILFGYIDDSKEHFKDLKFDEVNENMKALLKKIISFIIKH
jgi:ribonuclease P protein component